MIRKLITLTSWLRRWTPIVLLLWKECIHALIWLSSTSLLMRYRILQSCRENFTRHIWKPDMNWFCSLLTVGYNGCKNRKVIESKNRVTGLICVCRSDRSFASRRLNEENTLPVMLARCFWCRRFVSNTDRVEEKNDDGKKRITLGFKKIFTKNS